MKKPDFSKQGMSRFFLYHSEKLILAVSFVLLALFFWMGYSTTVFREKSPSELVQLAKQADQYIVSPTSWEKIEQLRQANDNAVVLINDKTKVNAGDLVFGVFSPKVPTRDKRNDPQLFPATDLVGYSFVAPVILSPKNVEPDKSVLDPLADLPPAVSTKKSETITGPLGGRGMGLGGLGGLGMSDEGAPGSDSAADKKPKKADEEDLKIEAGTSVQTFHQYTLPGVHPTHFGLSTFNEISMMRNVVAVTGVVDFKQQWSQYELSFSSGQGFYPSRDKPNYQFVQVERTEAVQGQEPKWEDISEKIAFTYPGLYPNLIQMPNATYPSAPECIAAENFDSILTQPIPPITLVDYRPFVSHPKIDPRVFDKLPEEDPSANISSRDGLFDHSSKPGDSTGNGIGNNQGRSGPPVGGGRRGGFGGTGIGGASMGGESGGGRPGAGRGQTGANGESIPERSGSNLDKYWKAIEAKKATKDYKLVRFFDLQAVAGVTYQYRVRLWLADPNNEDPTSQFAGSQSGRGSSFGSSAGGGGIPGEGGLSGESLGNDRSGGTQTGQGEEKGEGTEGENEVYSYVSVSHQMKAQNVRARLGLARDEDDKAKKGSKIYYVSEYRKAADGSEVAEEVRVPTGHDSLRYARPTQWSDPVQVSVKANDSSVFAGMIEPPKPLKFGTKIVPDGEPVSQVVSSVWSKKYHAALPARRTVYRGDALDFSAHIHVLNSVSWQVHQLKNAPILTKSVVIDMIGGDEIPLPRQEQMRHHLPSEVLIMKDDGTFHVANDMDDSTKFKQLLLLDDDSAEVGGAKERKKQKEREDSENTPGPGGRGAGGPGGGRG